VISRRGHSLAEAVAALVAGAVLLSVVASALRMQARIAADVRLAAAAADGSRTAWAVLSAELRYADPSTDVRAAAADSVALRSYRGLAVPCAAPDRFAYRGMRRPAAAKDSVVGSISGVTALVVSVADVAGDVPGDSLCGDVGGTLLLRMQMQPALEEERQPLLIFESGAYHVSGGALRFRLGAEGRQPLTDEWLDPRASGFVMDHRGRVTALQLAARPLGRLPGSARRLALPSLNSRSAADEPES
jgi:hypothetical protein